LQKTDTLGEGVGRGVEATFEPLGLVLEPLVVPAPFPFPFPLELGDLDDFPPLPLELGDLDDFPPLPLELEDLDDFPPLDDTLFELCNTKRNGEFKIFACFGQTNW
jgi:hypothetical protein